MKKIGLFFYLFLTSLSFYAQRELSPVFRTIVPEELGIQSIAYQTWDVYGRMWAVSDEGLFMYDGYKKKIIQHSVNPNSPLSNDVRTLQKVRDNEFWISYNDDFTLTKFNPITLEFKHFETDSINQHKLPPQMIVKIVDENDSIRWVLSWGSGLNRLNIQNGYVTRYVNESVLPANEKPSKIPDIIPCNFVKEFIKLDNENYMVGFFRESVGATPHIFNSKTEIFTPIDLSPYFANYPSDQLYILKKSLALIHFIHIDINQNYWLGTYIGLVFIDRQNETIERITHKSNDINRQNLDNTRAFVLDENNNLWISTPNQGIMYVDVNTKQVSYIQNDIYNATSIKDNRLRTINKDHFGNIWISTESGNLSVYNPLLQKFQIHPWSDMDLDFTNRSEQTIPVNQILVLDNGNILISNANGLVEYNSNYQEVVSTFNLLGKGKNLSNDNIKMILHFRRFGEKIIFVTGANIFKHNRIYEMIYENKSSKNIVEDRDLYQISIPFRHNSKEDPLLLYTKRPIISYLFHYDIQNDFLDTLCTFPENITFSEKFTLNLPSKNWLFPTSNGDLVYYYPESRKYDLYSRNSSDYYFPDSSVNCAIIDNKNQIWIGTDNGLYLFNENKKEFDKRNFQINIGESEKVSSIIQDNEGIYWIALNKDLVRWDKSKNELFRYNQTHGLDVGNFLPAVAQKDTAGNIYIATYNGILKFNPAALKMPNFNFKITVSNLSIMDSTYEFTDNLHDGLELKYDQNFLNFEFYSNQLFALQPHHFYYKLIGRDNDWQDNGISNKIRLADLSYGNYTLEIKAKNGYYQESNILSIPIYIAKPFWLTWWFISIILILVAGIVWAYIKFREKALLKRSEELEYTVALRTAEVVEEKQEAEKQRMIAEHQKEIVEEKQKEISDSIAYAKRIQNAILPSINYVQENLPNSFIFYLPKDIVAGDFYWMEKVENTAGEFIILAVADCTGHGVPGAMVSVVCHNALTRAVNEFNLYLPNEILNKTRELVIETLSNNDEQVNDGMDIALIAIQKKTNQIYFSGANNGLIILRNDEILEFKADKQPIGNFIHAKPFTLTTIDYKPNDQLYLYSDGYADQFGGEAGKPGGKKFKYSRLKSLFQEIAKESPQHQHDILHQNLIKWRGEIEQIDDICIVGIQM